jgi:putative FmdB family regulatory protein
MRPTTRAVDTVTLGPVALFLVPTYEYQCTACGREFEARQRISEPPLTRCETCGGAVKRLLSPAPFILKGGGWYVTDYPSESRKKALESEKSGGDSGSKKDGAPAEKPAADKASAPASSSTSTSPSAPAPSKPSTD